MAKQSTSAGTPLDLLRLTDGLILHQALYAAAQLKIADCLQDGGRSTSELGAQLRVHPDALYRTLRFLAGHGVFHEIAERTFVNSPLSEWMRSDVAGSVRSVLIYRGSPGYYTAFGSLLHSIETGAPSLAKTQEWNMFEQLRGNSSEALIFDEAMTELSMVWAAGIAAAYPFGSWQSLMDVGGGNGLLLATILKAHPLLRGVLVDTPEVVERARQREFWPSDQADRVRFAPADFFESVPSGCRAYLLRNVIHDWDDERALQILRNCRNAMPGDGVLLLVEYCVGGENIPSVGKTVDMVMLALSGGRERTLKEHRKLLERAGFQLEQAIAVSEDVMILEAKPVPD
jgi:hypothetical protein